MKNKALLTAILLLLSIVAYSQESFKKSLELLSTDLCAKMTAKGKNKVVVLFVTDINKAQTTMGKFMADVISFSIVNNQSGFSVFDRENLSGIAEAKKLIAEGYIDETNAKQLGKLLSVEAIVVGNYTVLSNTISLTLKALDVNDGFVIAQSLNALPLDNDAAALLGVTAASGGNNANRGFNNQPLNSNESYNNPETVNNNCETNNTGDYCISNNKGITITFVYYPGNNSGGYANYNQKSITIEPLETKCLYDLESGVWSYSYSDPTRRVRTGYATSTTNGGGNLTAATKYTGQFRVEKCKSKTLIIK